MAVTPVRTGPLPTINFPWPEMSVVWPTSTPFTSVMALFGSGGAVEGDAEIAGAGLGLGEGSEG